MSLFPQKNVSFSLYIDLKSQSTGLIQTNPTLAVGDVKVAVDDGAPANITVLPVVDGDFQDRVKVSLSAAETNGSVGVSIIFRDVAGAEWEPRHLYLPIEQPVSLPAQGTMPLTAFLDVMTAYMYKALRNPKKTSNSETQILADDAVTVDHKAGVSSDGTTTTQAKYISGA